MMKCFKPTMNVFKLSSFFHLKRYPRCVFLASLCEEVIYHGLYFFEYLKDAINISCSWKNLRLLTLVRFINVLIFQRNYLYSLLMNWGTWSAIRSVEEHILLYMGYFMCIFQVITWFLVMCDFPIWSCT